MLLFPYNFEGRTIKNYKELEELTGYSNSELLSLINQGITLNQIIQRSLNSQLYSYISSYYKGSLSNFLKEYNTYNYSLLNILLWFKTGYTYNQVLRRLKRFKYPVLYNSIMYSNDKEVSLSFNLPLSIVTNRRKNGMSLEEIITTPYHPYKNTERRTRNAEKNGYPYISPDGLVAYNDREMAEICNKEIHWVRNKRRFGWSPEEMYLGNVGIPESDYHKSTNGNSRSILLLNKYWYPSLKECLSRIGLSSYAHIVGSLDDKEEGIARAFIAFAKKYNNGYLIPSLKIDHLLHIYKDTAYYCCYIDEDVDYLSSKDILSFRMDYIRFDFNSHIYRNNGVFNNLKYAELFYCMGKGSISRKVKTDSISYEEAVRSIIRDKRHSNPLEIEGKIYNSVGAAAKKNKINKQTLHSRVKSEPSKDILRLTNSSFSITIDNWSEGRIIGKQSISYKTKKELLSKLGIPMATVYSRISQGDNFEQLINRELKKRNLYWCPFIKENYSSIKELCNITGLSKDRMYEAWRKGKSQNLTFWESLQRYYMNTRELFEKYKEGFTCKFPHGIFYLKDIVISEEQVYYHSITPSNLLRVMTFKDIFEVLIESRS